MKPQGVPQEAPLGHELKDASAPWILGFIVFLGAAGVCVHFGLAAMLRHLRQTPARGDDWRQIATPGTVTPRPNLPRLQISPPADLDNFRSREDVELNTYGWLNRTSGIVHIPITQAMDLLLLKGLPAASNSVGPSTLELQQQRPLHTAPEIKGNR